MKKIIKIVDICQCYRKTRKVAHFHGSQCCHRYLIVLFNSTSILNILANLLIINAAASDVTKPPGDTLVPVPSLG